MTFHSQIAPELAVAGRVEFTAHWFQNYVSQTEILSRISQVTGDKEHDFDSIDVVRKNLWFLNVQMRNSKIRSMA